jgi:hypothetical protein
MADDRMKNDDQQRNMGSTKRDDQDLGQGQQTPGRNPQGGQHTGGYGGGQQGGQQHKNPSNMEDDEEFGGGTTGQRGGQGRGGQNR